MRRRPQRKAPPLFSFRSSSEAASPMGWLPCCASFFLGSPRFHWRIGQLRGHDGLFTALQATDIHHNPPESAFRWKRGWATIRFHIATAGFWRNVVGSSVVTGARRAGRLPHNRVSRSTQGCCGSRGGSHRSACIRHTLPPVIAPALARDHSTRLSRANTASPPLDENGAGPTEI